MKLNDNTEIDLNVLIDTRLLVQANSGGGKSWLIRRLLEQSHGQVQQIVIDLEGEFSTLREKFDYVLCGADGDTPADTKGAAVLAKKLLELNVSAIVDLYELEPQERKHFVKLFLDALINAPKNLWHPVLIVIDEAHFFCPEKGQSEAMQSVINLCAMGRKRGFCAVLATQRLSKLHKDAAAECNNKLIGRTGLDVDMKRAYDELGFNTKEQYLSLRTLESGEFFAFGPAISNEVIKVKIGEVKTSHPKAGSRILVSPPSKPSEKISKILKALADIPSEAKKEKDEITYLKNKLMDLNYELRLAQGGKFITAPSPELVQKEVDKAISVLQQKFNIEKNEWIKVQQNFCNALEQIQTISSTEKLKILDWQESYRENRKNQNIENKPEIRHEKDPDVGQLEQLTTQPYSGEEKPITGGALRMLGVLANRYPMKFTKAQLATLSKLKSSSGTYGTYLSLLKTQELVEMDGDLIGITKKGLDLAGAIPQEQLDTISMWRSNLNGGALRMFELLVEKYPQVIYKQELAEETGLVASSGTFGTYLSMLRSNGLIEVKDGGVKASENLFI